MRTDYWNIENTIENLQMHEPPNGLVSYNYFRTGSEPRTIELSQGSYSITTNGIITLAFSDGEIGMAQLSENGQYVVYGFAEGEEGNGERWMGVGIKREAPELPMEQVTFNPDFAITPTGGTFSVSVPTNASVEIIHKSDLTESEWNSFGATNAPGGILQINDPGALYNDTQFYTATFGIW
jgi:hypothetical protein